MSMTIDNIIVLLQVKQVLKPITDGNYSRGEALESLKKLNLIYQHRHNYVLTSEGQSFIDTILKMGELL